MDSRVTDGGKDRLGDARSARHERTPQFRRLEQVVLGGYARRPSPRAIYALSTAVVAAAVYVGWWAWSVGWGAWSGDGLLRSIGFMTYVLGMVGTASVGGLLGWHLSKAETSWVEMADKALAEYQPANSEAFEVLQEHLALSVTERGLWDWEELRDWLQIERDALMQQLTEEPLEAERVRPAFPAKCN